MGMVNKSLHGRVWLIKSKSPCTSPYNISENFIQYFINIGKGESYINAINTYHTHIYSYKQIYLVIRNFRLATGWFIKSFDDAKILY